MRVAIVKSELSIGVSYFRTRAMVPGVRRNRLPLKISSSCLVESDGGRYFKRGIHMLEMFVRKPQRATRKQAGFTLVEMSVVLLVIGLILGAVSIGKDLQRDAEYIKIKQKFLDPWAAAYNSYFMRAGVVLGDSQVAPNFMVNGVNFTAGTSGSLGTMTGATAPAQICDAAVSGASPSLYDEMDKHGVRMPAGRAEGSESRYVYLDSNGNPQEIKVCFQWNKPGIASNAGNVMVISGLTPDLARALDQMIDGKADAQEGMFRQSTVTGTSTAGSPGVEWAANNTNNPSATPDVVANRLDEAQVMTVIAHYKMNQ